MTNTDLRRLRADLKLTQVQLALAIGVQPNTLARWECGTNPIPPLGATALTLYHEKAMREAPAPRRRRAS